MITRNCVTSTLRFMSTKIPKEAVSTPKKPQANNEINPIVTNRNPRNLEKMRLATKPEGFWFDKKEVNYWHKLKVTENRHGVTAELIHNTDRIVVTASTAEWAINKFLYSNQDRSAYIILAKVFAERCLESGIPYCYTDIKPKENTNIACFIDTVLKEGLTLEEPTTYNVYDDFRKMPEKRPWTVLED